jgi:hypothetical protein
MVRAPFQALEESGRFPRIGAFCRCGLRALRSCSIWGRAATSWWPATRHREVLSRRKSRGHCQRYQDQAQRDVRGFDVSPDAQGLAVLLRTFEAQAAAKRTTSPSFSASPTNSAASPHRQTDRLTRGTLRTAPNEHCLKWTRAGVPTESMGKRRRSATTKNTSASTC